MTSFVICYADVQTFQTSILQSKAGIMTSMNNYAIWERA